MSSAWPHYKQYLRNYAQMSRKLNGVLYDMCERMPSHTDEGAIWAKVWIIGRSYASGIERHAADGLGPIVGALRGSAKWLDPCLRRLVRMDSVPTHQRLPQIALLHGRLAEELGNHTRNGNQVRSFVSKYMHFHAPVVPIYDSVVNVELRARDWYPWSRALSKAHSTPDGVDEAYWQHCVRIALVADDWRSEGLEPTARNIDTYVYQWASEP